MSRTRNFRDCNSSKRAASTAVTLKTGNDSNSARTKLLLCAKTIFASDSNNEKNAENPVCENSSAAIFREGKRAAIEVKKRVEKTAILYLIFKRCSSRSILCMILLNSSEEGFGGFKLLNSFS